MNDRPIFNVLYDGDADVLYIATRKAPAARGAEDDFGILWRYDAGGDLIGATIMDLIDRWDGNKDALTQVISRGFHISNAQAELVLADAFAEGST